MKAIIVSALLIITSVLLTAQINTSQSIVEFTIKNFGINTVKGSFAGFQGSVQFDTQDDSKISFKVCIDAASVNTGNEKRDEHLKKNDYFDVASFPQICLESTNISRLFYAELGNEYLFKGILTMHGVKKEIEFPFKTDDSLFQGTFTIDRTDFGVGPKGGAMVGKEVEISIKCFVN